MSDNWWLCSLVPVSLSLDGSRLKCAGSIDWTVYICNVSQWRRRSWRSRQRQQLWQVVVAVLLLFRGWNGECVWELELLSYSLLHSIVVVLLLHITSSIIIIIITLNRINRWLADISNNSALVLCVCVDLWIVIVGCIITVQKALAVNSESSL